MGVRRALTCLEGVSFVFSIKRDICKPSHGLLFADEELLGMIPAGYDHGCFNLWELQSDGDNNPYHISSYQHHFASHPEDGCLVGLPFSETHHLTPFSSKAFLVTCT